MEYIMEYIQTLIKSDFDEVVVAGDRHCAIHSVLYGMSLLKGDDYINSILKERGFKNEIKLDGRSKQKIKYNIKTITEFRKLIYDYMKKSEKYDPPEGLKTNTYLEEMELSAICEIFNICIIVNAPERRYAKPGEYWVSATPPDLMETCETIVYLYNNFTGNQGLSTDHYNLLVPKKETSDRIYIEMAKLTKVKGSTSDKTKLKKEVVKPKKEEVKPKKEEVKPKKEEVEPKKEEVEPKKEEVKPKKEEVKPKTRKSESSIKPKKEEVKPKKEEVKPKTRKSESSIKPKKEEVKTKTRKSESSIKPKKEEPLKNADKSKIKKENISIDSDNSGYKTVSPFSNIENNYDFNSTISEILTRTK